MARQARPGPTRPRQPDDRQLPGRLDPRWVIPVVLAVIMVASGGLFLLNRVDAASEVTGPGSSPSRAAHDPTLELPLGLADVGFAATGEVRESGSDEGPGLPTWCAGTAEPVGLVRWRGNRLTDPDGQRRVAQLVAEFTSTQEATVYLAASSNLFGCSRWESSSDDGTMVFTVVPSPQPVGTAPAVDDLLRFDIEATGTIPILHLRALLVRAGAEVTLVTLVASDGDDLAGLETRVLDALDP